MRVIKLPLANIYVSDGRFIDQLESLATPLAEEVVKELSVAERKLTLDDVTVRIIKSKPGSKLLAPVEVEIVAKLFKERVDKADQVCNTLRKFMLSRLKAVSDLQVWLVLSELGHSSHD
jgi:hypothetical protein